MLPSLNLLRNALGGVIANKREQGHVVEGLHDELKALPDSYDTLNEFSLKLASLPLRDDWEYVEPNGLDEILAECASDRPQGPVAEINLEDCSNRVKSAFLGSVAGCILGKPLEFNPDLEMIKSAAEAHGEWPLNDYIPQQMLDTLGKRHGSWWDTTRENIQYVAPDDDINYTIIGMLALERGGISFSRKTLQQLWLTNLCPANTWGPERGVLLKAGVDPVLPKEGEEKFSEWVNILNPGDELCGAAIRADAYGYACPGRPDLAAEFAWRDAGMTHRRTGIYGTMYIAAAIACAQVMEDRLAIFETALKFVPKKSRFYQIISDSLNEISQASDWIDGYNRVHTKYKQYAHCKIYQEVGTLINSLKFAENVGDGICKQVSQGNDTDSFGATGGSILGAYFGPGHLEERWLDPFNNTIHTMLAEFHEQSLSKVAERMGKLPKLVDDQLTTQGKESGSEDSGPSAPEAGISGI